MFGPQREDIANIINETVTDIRSTNDTSAKCKKVFHLVQIFESLQISPAEMRASLQNLKDAAKSGDSESMKTLHGITEDLYKIAAQEGCANLSQYRGKLTAAFESAKHVMTENGAGAKTGLVDNVLQINADILLSIAERVSALQGAHYSSPQALYEAIKDVTLGSSKPKKENSSHFKL